MLQSLCFQIAKARIKSEVANNPASFNPHAYREWRERDLRAQFRKHFPESCLHGKRVLDFGCGTGELSYIAVHLGAAEVHGIEIDEKRLADAIQGARERDLPISFTRGHEDRIPYGDSSFDVILCFDVLEHIMDYRVIIREWYRVLAPGGHVLIWWCPWLHPYGHHLHTLIPVPWAHLFLSDASIHSVAADIYDLPQFRPRPWHFDQNGTRKPNPYRGATEYGYLNKLTVRGFEQACELSGLRVARKDVVPFSGRPATLKRFLAQLSEGFCANLAYDLIR